jgi:hypothetical protein
LRSPPVCVLKKLIQEKCCFLLLNHRLATEHGVNTRLEK